MTLARSDLKALVVGLGSIGNRHAQNLIAAGVQQITILRRKSKNAQFAAPPSSQVVHDLDSAIGTQPDFAIICTPSSQHVQQAQALIAHGIPCLIEKPLHGTIDNSVRQLDEHCQTTEPGRRSAMAYCMRFHPAYAQAFDEIRTGRIGKPLYAKAWFEGYLPSWHPWEDYKQSYAARPDQAGGVLRTLDHEIDFLGWVLGRADQSVGMVNNRDAIQIAADEIAHVTSRHRGGATSQITLAFCRRPPSRGFEFIGDQGVIKFDLASNDLTFADLNGQSHTLLHCADSSIPQMYVDLLDAFLEQFTTSTRSDYLAPVAAGLDSLAVITSIDDR